MPDQDIDFDLLAAQLDALIADEDDALANTANLVALIWQAMPDVNWVGVYVLRDRDLVLGPFQGKPACVRIPLGSGVCGTAAEERRTLRVADVHEFTGHIACDVASRSELVVPLTCDDRLLGVLDIDSPLENRFTARDQDGVEQVARHFLIQLQRSGRARVPFI